MNIIKSFSLMSFLTILSRILGYIRDLFFAFIFGASSTGDSFLLAFRLPNLFRRLFAEGAISNAFIPIYLDLKKKNKKVLEAFSTNVCVLLLAILLFIIILAEIYMFNIIKFLAPGFSENLIKKTSFLASIMFPYLVFISLSSFFGAMLNANGRYALWAFSPIILNSLMIAGMSLSYFQSLISEIVLAWSVILSGIIQFLVMFFWSYKNKLRIKNIKLQANPEVRKFFKLFLPNILAGGVLQLNQFVGIIFASSITGAISWLYYADRIVQLPLGIFVVSISTILLTLLSKYEAENNKKELKEKTDIACLLMTAFTLISMIGLFVISDLIVDTLFRRGQFGFGDVVATSDALIMYAIGLPAFGYIRIFSVIFFSKKNTKTPFYISTISMLTNFLFLIFLTNKMGHLGIALSLSLSGWINAVLLYIFLWKYGYWSLDKIFFIKLLKLFFCAFLSYIVLSISYMFVLYVDNFSLDGFIPKIITLIFLILIASITFLIFSFIFKLIKSNDIKEMKFKNIFKEKENG